MSYYDPLAGASVEREFKSNTRVVFAESPGSLTFEVQDVPAIAEVAHRRGALLMLDNTGRRRWGFPHLRAERTSRSTRARNTSAGTPTFWSGS